MPGLSISAALGAFGPALQKALEERRNRRVEADVGNALPTLGQGPGAAGAPQAGGLPDGLASLAGGQPSPQPQPGGAPISLSPQTTAQMSPAAMSGLAAVNADGGANPQGPPPPNPKLSGTAQSDAAGMDDPVQAAKQAWSSVSKSLQASNPGLKGRDLFLASKQVLEGMKGLAPLTRAAIDSQAKTLDRQQRWALGTRKLDEEDTFHAAKITDMQKRGATAEEVAAENARHHEASERLENEAIGERATAAADRDATTITAAGMRDDTSRANNENTVGGQNARSDANNDAKGDAAHSALYGRALSSVMANNPGMDPKTAAAAAAAAVAAMPARQGPSRASNNGGGAPKPSASDIQYLKKNPGQLKAFRAHFGDAAAQAAMK